MQLRLWGRLWPASVSKVMTGADMYAPRSSDSRGLVVSIAINGAGSKDGEPTLSLSLLNLGEVKKGTLLGPSQLQSRRSSWLGGLGLSEEDLKVIAKLQLADLGR